MKRHVELLVLCAVLLIPHAAAAQTPRDSVLAVIDAFTAAMTARDTAALSATQLSDGISYALEPQGDSVARHRSEFGAFVRYLATTSDTLVERIRDPEVRVHGAVATVWAPYDFHVNGRRTHCGIDAVTLVRTSSGWKIALWAYTVEPNGCTPEPPDQ